MPWSITTELIAFTVISIILLHSQKIGLVSNIRNKVFQFSLWISFISVSTNIASILMLDNLTVYLIWPTHLITTIYFIFTPLLGAAYLFYCVANLYSTEASARTVISFSLIPYGVFVCFLLANPWTGQFFTITVEDGYTRGSLWILCYVVFYVYCLMSLTLILIKSHACDDPTVIKHLLLFPLIVIPLSFLQQYFDSHTITGVMAACSLLIIYLYLQNKRVSVDFLTGLPNRQDFLKVLALKLKEKNCSITVIVISLNNFKFINDRFGPQNGDQLLQKLSSSLSRITRGSQLYRYGGDQFAVIIEGQSEDVLLNLLIRRLNAPVKIGAYSYIISAAVGVVQYPEIATDMESLINGIEYSLALAKKDKVSQFCYCTRKMLEEIRRKNVVLQIVQEALLEDSFEVHFQPIWSVEKCKFTMVEALLRLNDSTLGAISPAEFIPIAEDTGLIIDITYQVLGKVCDFIKEALEVGVDIDAVAVNMSFIQFMQEGLADKILNIIKSRGVPCSKIKIEITEGVLIANFEMVKEFIASMSCYDVRFGLDDFGTGYSNIASMLQIPFDTIKLDKSIIWSSMDNSKTAFFIKDITSAFKKMDMVVLAEGVETEEQYRFAVDCQCDGIQGFLFARPMPPADVKQLFLDQQNCKLEPYCHKS